MIEAPPRPRLLTEDATPEALGLLLALHGRIIAASDEGAAIFENLAGRYSRGSASWDIFNKAHSAADLVIDRKTGEPVIVWDPALTLVLATQPRALRDLWAKPGTEGRGVLARPLYAFPEPVYATGRTPAAAAELITDYDARLGNLFDDVPLLVVDDDGKPRPTQLRFDPDGEALFESYERELARERRALGTSDLVDDHAAFLGWLSKLAGQTARLAACIHVAHHWTQGVTTNTIIRPDSVAAAIALARYFHAHARACFALMGELPEQRRALAILDWLRTRTPTDLATLTVRDVQRSRGTAIEGIRASLGLLDDHGYIRLERQPSTSRGGRPSERVRVNPAIGQRSNRTDITDETLRPETRGSAGSVTEIEDVQ